MAKKGKDNSGDSMPAGSSAIKLSTLDKFVIDLPTLQTGVLSLDMAIGCLDPETGLPGIRVGDIAEIMGENNSFKSGTCDHLILNTQRRYGADSVVCLFSEPPDTRRMKRLGIDLDGIWCVGAGVEGTAATEVLAENCLEELLEFAKSPKIKLIVIDSVGALVSAAQMYDKGKLTDVTYNPVANQAKIINNFIGKFTKLVERECVLFIVNHFREPITTGFSATPMSLLRHKSGGGRGKEFASTIRILCNSQPHWREERHSVTDARIADGLEITYQVFKNKYSHSTLHRTVKAVFNTITGRLNNEEKLLEFAKYFTHTPVDEGGRAVLKSILDPQVLTAGSWITIGDERFQGTKKAVSYLEENPEIVEKLILQIAQHQEDFFEDSKSFTAEYLLDHVV